MSRLTPSKPGTDAELENALDILANRTWKCAQLSKLIRALTVDDSEEFHAPDIDNVADEFHLADKAVRDARESERMELPYMGATVGASDQPSWRAA
jgi:hypothetical protein